jgi:hypothetical protein
MINVETNPAFPAFVRAEHPVRAPGCRTPCAPRAAGRVLAVP